MPDRTKEELKEIFKDLREIKKNANSLARKTGFIAFPWESNKSERKREYYQEFVDDWSNLLQTEKVTSCEGVTQVRMAIRDWIEIRDKEYSFLNPSAQQKWSTEPITPHGLSLDELIQLTRSVIKGEATKSEEAKLNEALDHLDKCNIAQIDCEFLEEAAKLAFHPDEVTISEIDPSQEKPQTIYRG